MDEKIQKFFYRHNIHINDIKYLSREENKTCIYITDGRTVRTFITIKDFFKVLISYNFLSINKGVLVSRNHIDYIENCTYHMNDGTLLEGRKRTAAAHKSLNKALHQEPCTPFIDICSRFSILNQMPIACCVIELTYKEEGSGLDFLFRYCNRAFEQLEKKNKEDVLNQSFYKIFPYGARKLLPTYTDVAVNGGNRHIRFYSPGINRELIIKCFQPVENFCACMLIPVDELAK